MSTFEEVLARDGKLVYKTKGVSMEPMLRQNRDLVIIQAPASRLQKNDVALYKREDAYVLHRVIKVLDNGYLIRGDNSYTLENVPDSAVLGVLTGFQRKGKEHSVTEKRYLRYVRLRNATFPLRLFCVRVRGKARTAAKKLGFRRRRKDGAE